MDLKTECKQRVNAYFAETQLQRTGGAYLTTKAIIISIAFTITYTMNLVSPSWGWWIGLGILAASMGFNTGHDASHKTLSADIGRNNWIVLVFDLLGVSSMLWHIQHIVTHHPHVNSEKDGDIQQNPLFRFSPNQPWHPWHRFQAWYATPAYSMSYIAWIFRDFVLYFSGGKGDVKKRKITMREHVIFWTGKSVFFSLFILVPLHYLPWQNVVLGFSLYALTCGITTAIIFQLAHVVREAVFNLNESDNFKRQIVESINFSPNSTAMLWFTGGLNLQGVHHPFPQISHQHYRKILPIITEVCRKYEINVVSHSFVQAIRSHFLHLNDLGKKTK